MYAYSHFARFCHLLTEKYIVRAVRTLNVLCVALVPSGPGYAGINIANQVCATAGAVAGSNIVNGSEYVLLSFGYTFAHAWRNFGIIISFLIFFLFVNAISTEYQRDESETGAVMIFKRGSAPAIIDEVNNANGDEEKQLTGTPPLDHQIGEKVVPQVSASANIVPASDIFTWNNICYDVEIKGKTRRLLNNVSGFVAPGKMTALMGESGAGTFCRVNHFLFAILFLTPLSLRTNR